jgi:putative endonuclease
MADNNFYVYIIKSQTVDRYYCGYSKNPEQRLKQHNDPEYKLSRTTKIIPGPWKLIWTEKHNSRSSAMIKEKQIKKRGIKRFLNNKF